jgi:flagellar hook protein FlgE
MSLISSLYTGTTGLEVNTQELAIVGDNIANANTVGFKATRAAFNDQLTQTLLGSGQIGSGSRLQLAQQIFTQGTLTSTFNATDMALQGNGLFQVTGTHNGVTGSFFTRAGQFSIDKDGYLANLEGLRVQGYQVDSTGGVTGKIGDLALGGAAATPKATTNLTIKANLNSTAEVKAGFDPVVAGTTSNFSTAMTIFDTLGTAHQVSVYFVHTGGGNWDWHALADGAGIQGGTAGTPSEIASGTLAFDTNGALSDAQQTTNFNPNGATSPQTLNFNFGDPTGAGGSGLGGITSFSSDSAVSFASQDGWTAGQISGVKTQTDGTIIGAFTNGQSRVLGRVAVANFAAADRLGRVGGNLFVETQESGNPSLGTAGTGGRGAITGGSLEQSNVDMASEFVKMIEAQRNYQANARTVTTADQLLQELIQIKR